MKHFFPAYGYILKRGHAYAAEYGTVKPQQLPDRSNVYLSLLHLLTSKTSNVISLYFLPLKSFSFEGCKLLYTAAFLHLRSSLCRCGINGKSMQTVSFDRLHFPFYSNIFLYSPYPSSSIFSYGMKRSEAELMQYRRPPSDRGPSGNTCPK